EGLEGEPLTDAMVRHFDRCLGCLACVTACPSGVQYEPLIEATRQQVARRHRRGLVARLFRGMIFRLVPYPRRLRILSALMRPYQALHLPLLVRRGPLGRHLPARLRALESLIPDRPVRSAPVPVLTPARGRLRARVGLLT